MADPTGPVCELPCEKLVLDAPGTPWEYPMCELCRDFVEARARQERRTTDYTRPQTPDERFEQLLLCGMVTTQCAKVYNLSPQAGLLDPRTLFTGRPE